MWPMLRKLHMALLVGLSTCSIFCLVLIPVSFWRTPEVRRFSADAVEVMAVSGLIVIYHFPETEQGTGQAVWEVDAPPFGQTHSVEDFRAAATTFRWTEKWVYYPGTKITRKVMFPLWPAAVIFGLWPAVVAAKAIRHRRRMQRGFDVTLPEGVDNLSGQRSTGH